MNQKGSTNQLVMIIAIALILIAGLFFLKHQFAMRPNQAARPAGNSSDQAIQNDDGLMTASTELDNANLDGTIDPELNQNNADEQIFAPRIRLKNGTSTNWSGYAIETNLINPQNNIVNDVKGSWIVPSLSCNRTNAYSAAWVGIDGYSDNSVEQTGTEHDCVNGQPAYYVWYEMYPKPSFRVNLPVKAGDNISAEVQYITGNQFVLSINNTTTGLHFTTKQSSKAMRQSAEWIMEAPWSGGVLPLANFGTAPFSNARATLGNTTGTISSWQNDAITMADSSGSAKATPSVLSSDGSSFFVTWNSSN